jgi:hypothetical protein
MHNTFIPIPILAYDLLKLELSYIQTIKGALKVKHLLHTLVVWGVVPNVTSKIFGKAGQSKWLLFLKNNFVCIPPL